jgi:hypothetical protein
MRKMRKRIWKARFKAWVGGRGSTGSGIYGIPEGAHQEFGDVGNPPTDQPEEGLGRNGPKTPPIRDRIRSHDPFSSQEKDKERP